MLKRLPDRSAVVVAMLLLATAGCGPSSRHPGGGETALGPDAVPNLLVVLSDTHRRDYSPPGARAGELVNLAHFAREATVFTNAITPAPISAPAYASLLTGLPVAEHGLLNNAQTLSEDVDTLAESLLDLGWQTGAVVANPFCSERYGFAQGFESFVGVEELGGSRGKKVTEAAIRWLESQTLDRPFFLFTAYMDAHGPYVNDHQPFNLRIRVPGRPALDLRAYDAHERIEVPIEVEPGRSRIELQYLLADGSPAPSGWSSPLYLRGLEIADDEVEVVSSSGLDRVDGYADYQQLSGSALIEIDSRASSPRSVSLRFHPHRVWAPEEIAEQYSLGVREFDRAFGELLDYLKREGLYDSTLIVFLSDHGEMLGEHDGEWGHVDSVWEEALRIPLLVRAPGQREPVDQRALTDLTEVYRLLRSTVAANRFVPSSRPILYSATYPPEADHYKAAVRSDSLVLLLRERSGALELYDLSRDPRQQHPVPPDAGTRAIASRLVHRLRSEQERVASLELLDLDSLAPEEEAALRALGYLD